MTLHFKDSLKNISAYGFGNHSKPATFAEFKKKNTILRVCCAALAASICTGIVLMGAVSIFPVSLAVFPVFIPTLAVTISITLIASVALAISIIRLKRCKNALFGVLNHLNNKIKQPISLGKFGSCDAIACENTVESFRWKKKLIESAQHNIVLSGNYCGGKAFDEILDLVEQQMKKKPQLKVVLISSDRFINPSNKVKIENLLRQYGDQFQLIESPERTHYNPGIKRSTNHSKILAVDYGKYFILGGSGIEDKYAYSDGLEDNDDPSQNSPGGIINSLLPKRLRDQDFVFHCAEQEGVGKRVYVETLKLALRWEGINTKKAFAPDIQSAYDFETANSLAKDLILEETSSKKREKVTTRIEDFHQSPHISTRCNTKIFCTGPTHQSNPFEQELIDRINEAKERIIIDHMYFHPTKRVLNALVNAANRGVKITLITNGNNNGSTPITHHIFGPRNQHNYNQLLKKVSPKAKENIAIYEFKVPNTTLHKKVIVVDDYVIGGSSNLGYKSLVTMSDDEINFVVHNNLLAERVTEIALTVDAKVDKVKKNGKVKIGPSRKVTKPKIYFGKLVAATHRILAPIVG
jgi:phosphatidylserine/phosphatidylglycerophosphate/cardiolipin synthase-like enzyme